MTSIMKEMKFPPMSHLTTNRCGIYTFFWNKKMVYKKLDPPRPKKLNGALCQNLRNFLYREEIIGKFSSNLTRKLPRLRNSLKMYCCFIYLSFINAIKPCSPVEGPDIWKRCLINHLTPLAKICKNGPPVHKFSEC